MKRLLLVALLLAAGCVSKSRYIEGTHLALGAYLPFEDSIYGVELLQYTNGALLSAPTNLTVSLERDYAATNTYFWGMVETREHTHSKASTKK